MAVKRKDRIRVALLSLPGFDNFLGDIARGLENYFHIELCVSADHAKIAGAVARADVVWIEWANELAIGLTANPQLFNSKRVICRLHSYEAFDGLSEQVDWRVVDDLVFVAPHIRDIELGRDPDLPRKVRRIHIVPNGIDIDRFVPAGHGDGGDIAFLGAIDFKKGPMLLIQAAAHLAGIDRSFRIFIGGTVKEIRYSLYFEQMIKELGLAENIILDGWVDDVPAWLAGKRYILSTSVLEGHPVGIMEGMACGLKPLIHNFVGARGMFPDKYIWNTLPELATLATGSSHDPEEYRNFIRDNYSLEKQVEAIRDIIERSYAS